MRILGVFNRYVHFGGEELSVERIWSHLAEANDVERCWFHSKDWIGPQAPSRLTQLRRMFFNPEAKAELERHVLEHSSQVAVFHNIFPVGSPALYQAALEHKLPVVQFLHNFRPYSISGTLFARGQLMTEALRGNYWREVITGSWQNSVLKSALFALMLKRLHRSGRLSAVKQWIAVSEFMRTRLIENGMPADRITALRHSWDAQPEAPKHTDNGSYLFLGRLVDVKGIEPLLRAWRELRQQLGDKTPRLVIGGEGPLAEKIRREANPSVHYAGMLKGEAKREALRTCRALVVPSVWWEPLGLVVHEAYDYAKPVLAARAGGLIETVQQGITGLQHEPGNSTALAKDVVTLESMPEEKRRSLGQAGRHWLLTDASPARWKSQMQSILERVVKG
jgi:glycosyltransferase involved in cell wall biosynthesis